MNKNFLMIITGLVMFLSSFLLEISAGYALGFLGLVFMTTGIVRYYAYNQISYFFSLFLALVGLLLIYLQYRPGLFGTALSSFIIIFVLSCIYYFNRNLEVVE